MKKDQLRVLVQEGILTPEKASEIESFFMGNPARKSNVLNVVFSILGASLVALGIILIVAHNWDDLGRGIKSFFAFLPLIIGQAACAWYLFGKRKSAGLREGATSFLIISIGTCIALISQIYQIPGSMSGFLLLWILLSIPLIFIMNSKMAVILTIGLITWFGLDYIYLERVSISLWYLGFMTIIIAYSIRLYRKQSKSNFLTVIHWLIPISWLFGLNLFHNERHFYNEDIGLIFWAYITLFGLFYAIGNHDLFQNGSLWKRSYTILGSLGSMVMIMPFTFYDFWEEIDGKFHLLGLVALIFIVASIATHVMRKNSLSSLLTRPGNLISLTFSLIYVSHLLGIPLLTSTVFTNLLILGFGLLTVREGAEQNHFGILNYGLLIILILVICRFFDEGISFVIRGLLFLGTGFLFFIANRRLLKKRQQHET